MKTKEYIKPSIGKILIPELMQTILPGGSTPPGEGDAKQNNFNDFDDGDEDDDDNQNIYGDIWAK